MNTKDTFPALAAAPALLPLIAPYAAPILIGGAIAAGILWLLSDDKNPAPKRTGWGFFDTEDNEPDATTKPALTDTAHAAAVARIRDHDAKIAQAKRELARITAPRMVHATAVRTVTHQAAPAVAVSPRPAPSQAVPAAVMPLRDSATATPHRAVTPPVSVRDVAPMIAPGPVTPQTTPAVAASVTTPETPGRFQLKVRKYDRAHLEAVLRSGPTKRADVVKALKAAPFNYGNTLAYATLQRFADALEQTPDGLLTLKLAN